MNDEPEGGWTALVEDVVTVAGARTGFVVTDGGMSLAASGPRDGMDPENFVSLAAAQGAAARALARLVLRREFSELCQEGGRSTVRILALDRDWCLVLLHDGAVSPAAPQPSEQVTILNQAIEQRTMAGGQRPRDDGSGLSRPWTDEAESAIDRVFREGEE